VVVRRPEVPPAVAAVVGKLMAKRPEERYQTPAELAEALAPLAVYSPADEAGTISLPEPPPAVEEDLGTVRPGAAAGETMNPEGAGTRDEGAVPAPAPASGESSGDWSAARVPYVEPASPAGAVPAVAVRQNKAPAKPRRRPPVFLAAALVLGGAAVVAAAVALPSLSSLWQRPAGGATLAEDDRGRPVATTSREEGSERDNTKATAPEPRATPKADTGKDKPKDTGKAPPKDTGKPPAKPAEPLRAEIVLAIPPDMTVKQAAFAPYAGAAVVSSGRMNALGFCDQFGGTSKATYTSTTFLAAGLPSVASAVAVSGDGTRVFYAALIPNVGNGIGLWLTPNGTPSELATTVPDAVQFLSASDKGTFLLGGTKSARDTEYELYWWDLSELSNPRRVKIGEQKRPATLRGVGLSYDGARAVSFANGDGVRRWEVKEGKGKEKLPAWTRGVDTASVFAMSPAGNYVVFCDDNATLRLLDFESGEDRLKHPIKAEYVECLAVVEEAKKPLWVVGGDRFGNVRLWDVETGQPVPLKGESHKKNVLAIAVSDDHKYVYSLGVDNTIRRWQTPRASK
jgi:hypothetical protein